MTGLEIIQSTVDKDLGPLQAAVDRMRMLASAETGQDELEGSDADETQNPPHRTSEASGGDREPRPIPYWPHESVNSRVVGGHGQASGGL